MSVLPCPPTEGQATMFWVYILRCADNSYYTGHTDNLELRLGQHQTGDYPCYTSTRRPVELIWSQECATRIEALSAEQQIKGWSRKKKEAMMHNDRAEVSHLAKNKANDFIAPIRAEPTAESIHTKPIAEPVRAGSVAESVRAGLVAEPVRAELVEAWAGSATSPQTNNTAKSAD